MSRSMVWCIAALPGCHGDRTQLHHRRLRSQGGTDDAVNLAPLCGLCHTLVHANPDWSARHGLILRTGDDPAVLVTGCDLSCEEDHRV